MALSPRSLPTLRFIQRYWLGHRVIGGAALSPYASGQPEVTVARVTIPVGKALPLHEHPYMTAGVVLKGVIEVRTDSGKTHVARAGDAVIEMVNQPHAGANIGDEAAVILVVYAGIKD